MTIDPQLLLPQLIADVATLKGEICIILWLMVATVVPVWIGALNSLWKTETLRRFLNKKEKEQ